MIDCVGYIVPEALGNFEGDKPRMVLTPWSEESMPFDEAAEIGTRKVIREHSTIGVLVTCDGSFGELSRENYVDSEARIAAELHEIHKPFVIVLNSAHPEREDSVALALSLEEKYHAPVALVNCLELDKNDIRHILELVLLEFPVTEISVDMPDFMNALDRSHPIYRSVHETISACASEIEKTGDIAKCFEKATENQYIKEVRIARIDLGCGKATVEMKLADGLFYGLIGELTGFAVEDDEDIIMISSDGVIIRIAVSGISLFARPSKGVRIKKFGENSDAVILSVATTPHDEDEITDVPDAPDADAAVDAEDASEEDNENEAPLE
jgi:stage IV sporulation protein A